MVGGRPKTTTYVMRLDESFERPFLARSAVFGRCRQGEVQERRAIDA